MVDHDHDWLWRGTASVSQRRRKAAAVIAAVAQVLDAENSAGETGRSFVCAFDRFQSFTATTRERLAADPYAYYWGRLAYELLHLVLNPLVKPYGLAEYYCGITGMQPAAALARHLREFSRLLLGAAVLDGCDLILDLPLETDPPFALPGTPLGFEDRGRVIVHGVLDGRLTALSGDDGSPVAATVSPVAEYAGCMCRLQPAVFNVPISGIPRDISHLGLDFQADNAPRVVDALVLLRALDPEVFEQIRAGLRVVALRPKGPPGALNNTSHCDLPGAIAVLPYPHRYELGNVLLHEYLHNRLFALEEDGRFFQPNAAGDAGQHGLYSPWRDDYRPPHGLLHAVYVFTGVGRYWLQAAEAASTPQPVRDLAETRVLRGLYQVRLGLSQLRRYGRFTDLGRKVMDLLDQDHQQLWDNAKGLGIQSDLPDMTFCDAESAGVMVHDRTVRGLIKGHLHRYARREHVRGLETLV